MNRWINWTNLLWIGMGVLFAAVAAYITVMPDQRDRAVVIKVCDGLPIVKLEDGTTWLRYRWRYYRVEDPMKVC